MPLTIRATGEPPAQLRRSYLGSLTEHQELHVELMVAAGHTVLIEAGEETVGYAVVADRAIVEFFVADDQLAALAPALRLVLDATDADRALCKTFDALMVTAAASRPATTRTTGHLFRRIVEPTLVHNPGVVARAATTDDIERVESMHDGFFTDRDEISRYVQEGHLVVYESDGRALLGCGITTRVIPGLVGVDIGMVVAREHRRHGLGSYIVSDLKHRCLQRGDQPIAGCSTDNLGSRRALERAGFASAHSLIEFRY